MLKLCKEAGVCISIGSDAHIKESICDFDRAYKVIEEVGFPKELIVNSNTELYESYIGKDSKINKMYLLYDFTVLNCTIYYKCRLAKVEG